MRPPITADTWGTVYLLHLAAPLGNLQNVRAQAQHYIGWCLDLEQRLAEHRAGLGARLLAAAVERGISFEVVATWSAPLGFEKTLKKRKEAPKLCGVCAKAHGRRCKPAVLTIHQLELPLISPVISLSDITEDFPPAPALRMDAYEYLIQRSMRAGRAGLVVPSGHLDDDLL